MSTGQKYSGKGDSTTSPAKKGSKVEQTVTTSDPTVETAAPARETFTFKDLQIFSRLSDSDKKILIEAYSKGNPINWQLEQMPEEQIHEGQYSYSDLLLYAQLSESAKYLADWVVDKGYSEDQVKLALDWLSKSNGSTSPSEKIDGISLSEIIGHKVEFPSDLPKPKLIRKLKEDFNFSEKLYSCLNTHAQAHAMINAATKMYSYFLRSEDYDNIESFETQLSYTLLQKAFVYMISQAATEKLGAPEKPFDMYYYGPVPNLKIGENVIDESGLLSENPANCDDASNLRVWVYSLQEMVKTQQKAQAKKDAVIPVDPENVHLKQVISDQEATIQRLTKRLEEKKVPVLESSVSQNFNVRAGHKSWSEATILYFALTEYRDSRQQQYAEELADEDLEGAYSTYMDFKTAQGILDSLLMNTFDLAQNNFNAAYFPTKAQYLADQNTGKKCYDRTYFLFLEKHNRIVNAPEVPTNDEGEPLEPAYLKGLTGSQRQKIVKQMDRWVSDDDLMALRIKLYGAPKNMTSSKRTK